MSRVASHEGSLRTLVDGWTIPALAFWSLTASLQAARRAGMRPHEDGWRRASRAYFRREEAKYCLATFGLSLPAESESLTAKLAAFLQTEPELRRRLEWTRFQARVLHTDVVDVVSADYEPGGRLRILRPLLDPAHPAADSLAAPLRLQLEAALVYAYNTTLNVRDERRPAALQRRLAKLVASRRDLSPENRRDAIEYTRRLLSAVYVVTAPPATAEERFTAPRFTKLRHPGCGILTVVCRVAPSADASGSADSQVALVDLWLQFSHPAIDGAPAQDLVDRLKAAWQLASPLRVPAARVGWWSPPALCSTSARSPRAARYFTQGFIDLSAVLAARRELKEHPRAGESTPSLAGMLVWGLSLNPRLSALKFAVTVDVPAQGDWERTMGIALTRPQRFRRQTSPRSGSLGLMGEFALFQRDLTEQIAATRERRGASHELLQSLALVSPALYPLVLRLLPRGLEALVGGAVVSVVRTAEIVLLALDEHARDGSIGVGSLLVPTDDGRRVGSVCIKGTYEQVCRGREAVEAMAALWDAGHWDD
jgi:hypothetical protein